MSHAQWRKLDVVARVERGEFTVSEGAQALGLSRRQVQRLRKKIRAEGHKGVLHGNTGRAPKHKTPDLVAARVIQLWRDKYRGFNDQHFTEKLAEAEGLAISRQTIRRLLRKAGIGSPRQRRPNRHRRRRDRRPQAGQMILWDGSRHDWLEDRGPMLCLMGAIDDATGELLPGAHFVDQECSAGYLRVLRDIIATKGVPLSAYMDQHGALKRNDKNWTRAEQLAGRQDPTHVKRALDDLGIQVIYALSPQAKGRVERLWGTLQDRLVSELRLVGANDIRTANKVLLKYTPQHNAKFAIPPQSANSAWRPLPAGLTPDELCAFQYVRVVQNNNTVRVGTKVIDIKQHPTRRTFARAKVLVRHLLVGGFRVYFNGERIAGANGPGARGPLNRPNHPRARQLRAASDHEDDRTGVTESLAC